MSRASFVQKMSLVAASAAALRVEIASEIAGPHDSAAVPASSSSTSETDRYAVGLKCNTKGKAGKPVKYRSGHVESDGGASTITRTVRINGDTNIAFNFQKGTTDVQVSLRDDFFVDPTDNDLILTAINGQAVDTDKENSEVHHEDVLKFELKDKALFCQVFFADQKFNVANQIEVLENKRKVYIGQTADTGKQSHTEQDLAEASTTRVNALKKEIDTLILAKIHLEKVQEDQQQYVEFFKYNLMAPQAPSDKFGKFSFYDPKQVVYLNTECPDFNAKCTKEKSTWQKYNGAADNDMSFGKYFWNFGFDAKRKQVFVKVFGNHITAQKVEETGHFGEKVETLAVKSGDVVKLSISHRGKKPDTKFIKVFFDKDHVFPPPQLEKKDSNPLILPSLGLEGVADVK